MPNKRALIVDDSSTAQYRLKKMLRSYSLDIDTADSGEAALRYLAHQSPDVIFMDHLMPGMDGFRALQIIKSHPETATIPVIMYTSKSGDLYTGQARALGALDVVSKDTINAADLSKVMEAIHIFRTKKTSEDEAALPDVTEVIDTLPDISEPKIERRAPHPASIEQSRNLELRLGHMELALEDNRRFITARVARELNGLRHSLKKEITELLTHNQPALESDETVTPTEAPIQRSSVLSKFIFLAALITIIFFCVKIISLLSESQQQQQELALQVAALASQKTMGKTTSAALSPATSVSTVATPKAQGASYLSDLAWTFNQNGQLPFYQNRIEPKKLVQLYELLNRISSAGFKGDAWITLYVGNFCLSMDNYGVAQIPKDTANMSECVFSSEIYGLDRVMEEYTHDAEAALTNLEQASDKNIRVIISTVSEPDSYPERKPALTAKAWNNSAQNHNRIEIRLEPTTSTASR